MRGECPGFDSQLQYDVRNLGIFGGYFGPSFSPQPHGPQTALSTHTEQVQTQRHDLDQGAQKPHIILAQGVRPTRGTVHCTSTACNASSFELPK